MKRTALLLLLFVVVLQVSSQSLEGCYRHQNDSISFTGNEVAFSISGFGALTTIMVGEGTFELIDNFLLVHTTDYSGDKSIAHSFDGNIEDTLRVQVTTLENYPINGAMVDFVNAKGRSIQRLVSDNNGRVNLYKNPKQINKIAQIKISNLGLDEVAVDFDNNNDYLIKLANNNVIENQTMAFEIKESDVATISVVLVDQNFIEGKNRIKSLQRLSKRTQKRNTLGKIFRKKHDAMFDGR